MTLAIWSAELRPVLGEKARRMDCDEAVDQQGGPSHHGIESTTNAMGMTEGTEFFKRMYDNPLMNAAITFTEPFPIGLLVAVVSACSAE
jgi:hypothetical protein